MNLPIQWTGRKIIHWVGTKIGVIALLGMIAFANVAIAAGNSSYFVPSLGALGSSFVGLQQSRNSVSVGGQNAVSLSPTSQNFGGAQTVLMDAKDLRFSQTTAGGGGATDPVAVTKMENLRQSLAQGWNGPPIDAVKTDQGIVSLDNRRAAIQQELGAKIPVKIHELNELLPDEYLTDRFWSTKNAKTYGDILKYKTSHQLPEPLALSGQVEPPIMPGKPPTPADAIYKLGDKLDDLKTASAFQEASAVGNVADDILRSGSIAGEIGSAAAGKSLATLSTKSNLWAKTMNGAGKAITNFMDDAANLAGKALTPIAKVLAPLTDALAPLGAAAKAVAPYAGAAAGALGVVFGTIQAINQGKKAWEIATGEEGAAALITTQEGRSAGLRTLSGTLAAVSGAAAIGAIALSPTLIGGVSLGTIALVAGVASLALEGAALVNDHWNEITDTVSNAIQTAKQTITRTVKKLVPVVREVTEWVTTKVQETYQYAVEQTKQIAETVMQKVQEAYEVVRQVPRQVTEWVTERVQETRRVARIVYENVTSYITEKVAVVVPVVRQVAHTVYDTVVEWIPQSVRSGWGRFVSWVTQWVQRARQVARTVWTNVTDYVTKLVDQTRQVVTRVARTVYDNVTEWVDRAKQVTRTVYDTVKSTAYRLVEKPVTIIKNITETVWKTGTRLVEKVTPVTRKVTEMVEQELTETVEI